LTPLPYYRPTGCQGNPLATRHSPPSFPLFSSWMQPRTRRKRMISSSWWH
jgi:hypothetical protein